MHDRNLTSSLALPTLVNDKTPYYHKDDTLPKLHNLIGVLNFAGEPLDTHVHVKQFEQTRDYKLLLLGLDVCLDHLLAVVPKLVPLVLFLKDAESEFEVKVFFGLANDVQVDLACLVEHLTLQKLLVVVLHHPVVLLNCDVVQDVVFILRRVQLSGVIGI